MMIITLIAAILFVGLVGVTLLGRRVGRCLPEDQLSADSKDAVKLAPGLYRDDDRCTAGAAHHLS
jgi:hypothetical protein